MDNYDDDEGFVGYVPSTTDPGPLFLFLAIIVFLFVLITLPLAVILGEKQEELKLRTAATHDSETDEDGDQRGDDSGQGAPDDDNDDDDDDNISQDNVSEASRRSYISEVFTGAIREIKEIIEQQPGRVVRTRGVHRRIKRRRRDPPPIPTNIGEEKAPVVDMVISTSSQAPTTQPSSPVEDDDARLVPFEASLLDGTKNSAAVACKVDDTVIDRAVCYTMDGVLDEIAAIMTFDHEMKRIIKLSVPFATQAIFTGVMDILTVGVIGKLVGTRAVSAFVVVNLLVELTTQFVGGFHEALCTLCPQAIGAKKHRLAGKYVQIATILYVVTFIPFALLWVAIIDDAIRWFGFDKETIEMGTQYAYLLLFDSLINGVSEAVHALLDVSGHENYSTIIGATEETIAFFIVLIFGLLGAPSLVVSPLFTVGLIQFLMGILFLGLNCLIIWRNGWFEPYRSGMFGSFALSVSSHVFLFLC